MHYTGYSRTVEEVKQFDRQELLDLIESLFGWGWHEDGIAEDQKDDVSTDRLREEALHQLDWEWRVPTQHLHHYPDREE
jgi:hypothetical protein